MKYDNICLMNSINNNDRYISISRFTDILKANLESNFPYVYLRGEISNFRPSSTGIWYLLLKDEQAAIRGIIFRNCQSTILNTLKRFNLKGLQNGQEVLVEGRLNLYKKGGDYSIVIERVTPVGLGDLYLKFEELKKRLEKEGLFDQAAKQPLPPYPAHIGIVTSATGAALQDMLNVLKRRSSSLRITVFPAIVQGDAAKHDICKAISCANYHWQNKTDRKVDVLIVARGGGSIEDLWCFNEEEVAHAIYESPIPIITGIGHEIDFTIADFCADMRAPTPSAAAELVAKNSDDLYNNVASYKLRIEASFHNYLDRLRYRTEQCSSERLTRHFERLYQEKAQNFNYLEEKLLGEFKEQLNSKRQRFALLTQKLNSLSPLNILSRGYSLTYDKDENIVKSTSQVEIGEEIKIILNEGSLKAKVSAKD